jgi:hypothetical protein
VDQRNSGNVADRVDRLTRELTEERASALRRISRMLESLIDELHGIRARVESLEVPDRARERAAYDEVRRQALLYRWYLEVQRDALGLHQHDRLDEFYKVPGPLDR